MKRGLIAVLSGLLGVFVVWFLFTQIPFTEVLSSFEAFSWTTLIKYLVMSVMIFVALALRWKFIARAMGHDVPFKNIFTYRIIGNGVSYFTPTAKLGGEPVRAMLMKKHGVKFKDGLLTVITDKLIELASHGFFFFIGVVIILFTFSVPNDVRLMLFFAAVIAGGLAGYYYIHMLQGKAFLTKAFRGTRLHKIKRLSKFEHKLLEFEKLIIQFYQKDKKDFWFALGISGLSWIFMFLEYKFAAQLLGIDLSMIEIFLIVSFVGASYLIPTPMSIGGLELGQVGIFTILKYGTGVGLAMGLIVRVRDTLWALLGLILLSIQGLKLRSTIADEKSITEEIERLEDD